MTTIPAILQENASRWPARPALVATRHGRDVHLTFAEIEAASQNFASRLTKNGISPGDHVLIFVPMSVELYVSLLGLFRIGAVAVFLDPSSGLGHINACCRHLPPRALISVWPLRLLRLFSSGLRRIPLVFSPPTPVLDQASEGSSPFPHPDDPALITFTSGSTGEPKAAVRSHRFLIAQHAALQQSIQLTSGEIDLTTLPVFVLANLASGITSVLPDAKISRPGSVDATRIARQTRRLQPTRTGGSPAFYQRLMTEPDSLKGFQKIYTGGAPVFPAFLQQLQSMAPEADVVAVYGSTEAEPIAHVSCRDIAPDDWRAMRTGRGLLAGKPVEGIRLHIVADQWGQSLATHAPLPPGEIGEIIVTGDHVLKGYLQGRGDGETKVRLDGDIWHRTGDSGYLDASGRLWLLGRCSARVQDQHGTIYPFAVECVAMSFAGVRRAAFLRTRDRHVLVLEITPAFSPDDHGEIFSSLAWASIDEIRILPRIPVDKRHNAKVNYPELIRLVNRD